MTDPSFYFAIFKRLQGCDGGLADGSSHFTENNPPELAGGFSLTHPHHPNGLFGKLTSVPGGSCPAGLDMQPLLSGTTVPNDNPFYVVLNACKLGQMGVSVSVPMGFEKWPVMPNYGNVASNTVWQESNSGGNDLMAALANWISKSKPDDTPKPSQLLYTTLSATPPTLFPGLTHHDQPQPPFVINPILFVACKQGDSGRRPGDGGSTPAPPDAMPPNFWATSQIFLLETANGALHHGELKKGETYYVAAVIGNSGNWPAGRLASGVPQIHVQCAAQAFNSGFSPGVPLASLSNLNPADMQGIYEQYGLRPESYAVVGFRFDVDDVFARLATALTGPPLNLSHADAVAWLKGGHPCVKVFITSGETKNNLNPPWNSVPSEKSDPTKDRRVAQHNLADFDMTLPGPKKPMWKNFIVAQMGAAASNLLQLQHDLPETFQFFVAMPKDTYERYVRKGGALRNFEEVRDPPPTPFRDAVVLREKGRGGEIVVAAHDHEMFLRMSLGVTCELRKPGRIGDVSLVHHGHGNNIAGGFTLQLNAVADR